MKKRKPRPVVTRPLPSPFFTPFSGESPAGERILSLTAQKLQLEKKSASEIALTLGVPEQTVKHWLASAALNLYRYLSEVRQTEEEHLRLARVAAIEEAIPEFTTALKDSLEGKTQAVLPAVGGPTIVDYKDGKIRTEAIKHFLGFLQTPGAGLQIAVNQNVDQKQGVMTGVVEQGLDFESIVRMLDAGK